MVVHGAGQRAPVGSSMVFTKRLREGIRRGRIKCSVRIWMRPHVKVGGRYEPKDGKIAAVKTFVSKTGESADLRRQTQQENMGWYSGIVADIFS